MEKRKQAGGLWNCPRATTTYSEGTQKMLKLVMEESRLTHLQRRQINTCLAEGASLPPTCGPSSSAPAPPHPQQKAVTQQRLSEDRRRSAEACRSGDNYCREQFRPGPTRDLEKEKRRLQHILATGKEEPKLKPKTPPAAVHIDRFQEVLDEIEESRQFLADMTALGQGKLHQSQINAQISQNIHELEMIDKTRCTEMRDFIYGKIKSSDQ